MAEYWISLHGGAITGVRTATHVILNERYDAMMCCPELREMEKWPKIYAGLWLTKCVSQKSLDGDEQEMTRHPASG